MSLPLSRALGGAVETLIFASHQCLWHTTSEKFLSRIVSTKTERSRLPACLSHRFVPNNMVHEIGTYLLLVGLRRSNTSAAYRTEAPVAWCFFLPRLAYAGMASTGSGLGCMKDGECFAVTNNDPPAITRTRERYIRRHWTWDRL